MIMKKTILIFAIALISLVSQAQYTYTVTDTVYNINGLHSDSAVVQFTPNLGFGLNRIIRFDFRFYPNLAAMNKGLNPFEPVINNEYILSFSKDYSGGTFPPSDETVYFDLLAFLKLKFGAGNVK